MNRYLNIKFIVSQSNIKIGVQYVPIMWWKTEEKVLFKLTSFGSYGNKIYDLHVIFVLWRLRHNKIVRKNGIRDDNAVARSPREGLFYNCENSAC